MAMITWPVRTQLPCPEGFPKSPLILVWSLSTPAQNNIWLMQKDVGRVDGKAIFATTLHHVFVCTKTGSLQGLGPETQILASGMPTLGVACSSNTGNTGLPVVDTTIFVVPQRQRG
ncbi:hypothetical protein TREES_T100004326 [Tupaia chinensis]|uniref:Uncharacterized protein n=1 Tax=Tupaia chinensis TaxID=246437 RepID=L9KKA3_TUPCH|nr:hypothetical protein TREES_T100004326 [Tupaia chinensis]